VIGHVVVFVVHTWPEIDPENGEEVGRIISARKATAQQAEIEVLAALPDNKIDTRDMPEIRDWSGARRGVFFRPIKKQLTLRLDADVIAWFKRQTPSGDGYQTSINRALREYMEQHTDASPDRS
jgi:uncharacterized protein (DUF4415 family)